MIVYIIGPSGCGKTVVGRAVSEALGAVFLDADDFHSAEARSKMARGIPLTDGDRAPWLERVRDAAAAADGDAVVACSALRRVYREVLRAHGDAVRFFALDVSAVELCRRAEARERLGGHFMPAAQVPHQIRTWEPPGREERDAMVVPAEGPVERIAEAIVRAMR